MVQDIQRTQKYCTAIICYLSYHDIICHIKLFHQLVGVGLLI